MTIEKRNTSMNGEPEETLYDLDGVEEVAVGTQPKRIRPSRRGGPHVLSVLSTLQPLGQRSTLVEQVAEQLRHGIVSGAFPVASELPSEGSLAESMGVSYTVVREAMRVLRSQGLIDVSQGRRPRVRPIGPEAVQENLELMLRRSDSSLHELTDLRQLLETQIAAEAARRATAEEVETMQRAIDDQTTASDLDERIEADTRFHELLSEIAHKPLFSLILSTVSGLIRESRRRTISQVGVEHAIEDHRRILEAVRLHDSEAARAAMQYHLRHTKEDLAPFTDGDGHGGPE